MKRFAALCAALDSTDSTRAHVAALVRYLREASDEDAAWAVHLLAGGRPPRLLHGAPLRALAAEASGLPGWLFESCLKAVGDLAETIAHVLPEPAGGGDPLGLSDWMTERLLPLRGADAATVRDRLPGWWREIDAPSRFLLTRFVSGGFRSGVSRPLVERAVAEHAGLDARQVALRMADFPGARRPPCAAAWRALVAPVADPVARDPGLPHPFLLAQSLVHAPGAALGPVSDWVAEWLFHGLRCQVVRHAGAVRVWSREGALVNGAFPEIAEQAAAWPGGTVVEGVLVAWDAHTEALPGTPPDVQSVGGPAPFAPLQRRIGRRAVTARLRAEVPVAFIAHDLLAWRGRDFRAEPQHARRAALLAFADTAAPRVLCSPVLPAASWDALGEWRGRARALGVQGLVLKRRDSAHGAGAWWTWKADPMAVDGVLLYAQAGLGRGALPGIECTLAVWSRAPRDAAEAQAVVQAIAERRAPDPRGLRLVPLAKVASGLADEAVMALDAVVRRTTLETFGPVRSLLPTLVVEMAYEGIAPSARHKSGVALRLPRMLRVRPDKPLHEAATLQDLGAP